MKKVIGFMMVAVFALAFVACGNKAAEQAKAKADSTRVADSLAMVAKVEAEAMAAAKAKADSVAAQAKADSIAAATKTKKKK
jgi:ABC-type Zn uptake system ZnuABC Zn-binding protein ZnuA